MPKGETTPVAIGLGIAISAGIDLAWQLWLNDCDISCVNWLEVGVSGAIGGLPP